MKRSGLIVKSMSGHFPGDTERNHEKHQASRCLGRDSNWALPEYKSEESALESTCPVKINEA
jgi:hypothetical protein